MVTFNDDDGLFHTTRGERLATGYYGLPKTFSPAEAPDRIAQLKSAAHVLNSMAVDVSFGYWHRESSIGVFSNARFRLNLARQIEDLLPHPEADLLAEDPSLFDDLEQPISGIDFE